MAKVVSIDKGIVDKLALRLAAELRGGGSLTRDIADVENVTVWRKAARKAGRISATVSGPACQAQTSGWWTTTTR